MPTDDQPQPDALTPQAAEAIDRLLERGFDPASDAPGARLLGLLGTPLGDEDPALVDVAFLRCMLEHEPELCPTDAEALDALSMAGGDATRVPRALRERAERHNRLRRVATTPLVAESAGATELIDSTLDRVQRTIDDQEEALRLRPRRSGISNLRFGDLIAIAAMLLIVSAVIMPLQSGLRAQSAQTVCEANLQNTAQAMGLYAGQNRSALPVATAGFGGSWMKVGTTPEKSNSANLYTLVREGYAKLNDLACPGNDDAPTVAADPHATDWRNLDEVSYSYQIVTRFHPDWRVKHDGRPFVILADRSPVVRRIAAGDPVNPFENSSNHRSAGQHLMTNDGSVSWVTTPVHVSGDNIWLPRSIELAIDEIRARHGLLRLRGNELPDTPDDIFLGP